VCEGVKDKKSEMSGCRACVCRADAVEQPKLAHEPTTFLSPYAHAHSLATHPPTMRASTRPLLKTVNVLEPTFLKA